MTVTVKKNLYVFCSEHTNNPVISNIDSKFKMDNWQVDDRDSAETMCCFAVFTTIIFSRYNVAL